MGIGNAMTQSGFTPFGNSVPESQNFSAIAGNAPANASNQALPLTPKASSTAAKPQALPSLENLLSNIQSLPLWIKQVVYAELRADMEKHFVKKTLDTFSREHLLPLFVPSLTALGLKNISYPEPNLNRVLHRLIYLANQSTSVVHMCVGEQWTLADCSTYLLEALKLNLIQIPASTIVYATIEYLSGSIRLGNYMVKIGRISLQQLEEALRTQHYISEAMGEKTGIANVLINLGYISKDDAEGVLFLKAESHKRYQPNP
jgi:hypothetical protein